ncbi:MAG: glycosyltransferase family 2 protein [Armatimonadetes bacterium]|nr:glycosyltransferase family 2 protein [Armatimonadota bacterium]MDW8120961.1 glycosyltransferase family 2 protein [Armatimonadota bacterium]
MDLKRLSVVLPAYNESENIVTLLREIALIAPTLGLAVEVIVVDDGSDDGTSASVSSVVDGLLSSIETIVLIRLNRRCGQTMATTVGLAYATGEAVVIMDADGQNDPADIPTLVALFKEGYDLVCGWRKDRKDARLKKVLPSKIANRLIASLTGVPVRDLGCSLRVYRRWLVERLLEHGFHHRYLPIFCSALGARMTEVPVHHRPRLRGHSKYGLSRIFSVLKDLPFLVALSRLPTPSVVDRVLVGLSGAFFVSAGTLAAFLGLSLIGVGLAIVSFLLGVATFLVWRRVRKWWQPLGRRSLTDVVAEIRQFTGVSAS